MPQRFWQAVAINLAGIRRSPRRTPTTLNIKPPTSNLQPQTSNLQPPTSNLQPRTSNLQPPTSNLEPPTPSSVFGFFTGLKLFAYTSATTKIFFEKFCLSENVRISCHLLALKFVVNVIDVSFHCHRRDGCLHTFRRLSGSSCISVCLCCRFRVRVRVRVLLRWFDNAALIFPKIDRVGLREDFQLVFTS